MKNPITRVMYAAIGIAILFALFDKEISDKKFELMIYLFGAMTAMFVIRSETLGVIFTNISEGVKNKWKN